MYASSRRLVAAAIVLTLFAAVVFQPKAAEAQSSNPIVNVALSKVGGHGGQCKVFVQNVVRQATGISIGSGYRQAFLNAGVEVNPANAQPGDILQVSNPSNHERYHPGYHTAIVVENLGGGRYKVVDSNWGWDERVQVHEWTPRPASHLRLYAYRVGGSSSSGSSGSSTNASAPTTNRTAPSLSTGDTATIDTGDSCLNLRSGAGLGHSRIDCLSAGGELTVLSGATKADSHTWVKVRTGAGQEGWVAAEYLKKTSSAPESIPDAPDLSQGASASVDTDGSCLYLRESAGLEQAIKDCMPDGTNVSVVSAETTSANGYTWVQVETSSGSRGWVASEYLAAN